ncbi:phosphoribosylanthranilate isomerase [Neobacillus dielmonensis]|uniref:phosphoribosylanthranilate isomerase n=1 Tax=Neobacillus dielmonensis TaxID=1347369 RepID=UPI0005A7407F|nr:phosphoribosylanthranilate isomerase [Neobacillus dielmonensis]
MKIKICGITDVETGVKAAEYGADAIGFVFAESKRKVAETTAKAIIDRLPQEVFKVGVFVNESGEEIERIAAFVGLTHIQLHGEETAEMCESLTLPVIKAINFQNNERLAELNTYPSEFLLLDGPKGKYRGGNGTSFDWKQVDTNVLKEKKLILAGGLNPDNVESAIKMINPYMVDVSSGVETDGIKDLNKIKKFISQAKSSRQEEVR